MAPRTRRASDPTIRQVCFYLAPSPWLYLSLTMRQSMWEDGAQVDGGQGVVLAHMYLSMAGLEGGQGGGHTHKYTALK